MKMSMFAIYDTVAEVFNKPFTDHNEGSASRAFTQSLLEHDAKNKNDYVLYKVGEWNDASGEITPQAPMKVISGFDISREGQIKTEELKTA